jgi:hypothetical protein
MPGMVISRATTGSSRGPDGQLAVEGLEFGAMEVELADQRFDTAPLIARQLLLGEPVSASPTEQVTHGAGGGEVASQDGVDLVLEPGALTDQVGATGDLAAQRAGPFVGQPHRRQEVRGQQLRQDAGGCRVALPRNLPIAQTNAPVDTSPHSQVPQIDVKVTDPVSGEVVPPGTLGQLCIRAFR